MYAAILTTRGFRWEGGISKRAVVEVAKVEC